MLGHLAPWVFVLSAAVWHNLSSDYTADYSSNQFIGIFFTHCTTYYLVQRQNTSLLRVWGTVPHQWDGLCFSEVRWFPTYLSLPPSVQSVNKRFSSENTGRSEPMLVTRVSWANRIQYTEPQSFELNIPSALSELPEHLGWQDRTTGTYSPQLALGTSRQATVS